MARIMLAVCLLLPLAGCFQGDVTVPDQVVIGGREVYSSPPPALIAPANSNSPTDLRRENLELKNRIAWLQQQNEKSSRKYDNLGKDMADISADMAKISTERDRYRRAAGY